MHSVHTARATTAAVRRIVRLLDECNVPTCSESMLVMCSGGVDSVVLAYLMCTLPSGRKPARVGLLWLDHALRDTTEDERVVAAHAHALGVDLHRMRCAPGELLDQATRDVSGIQAAARVWRYRQAESVAHAHGYSMIVAGHTADDQLETALHRMLSTSGNHGLAGIRVVRQLEHATLVRPLLTTSRDEVTAVAQEAELTWVEDPSNTDTRFRRSELRHHIIPALDAAYPGARHAITRTAERAASQASAEQSLARAWIRARACTTHEHTTASPAVCAPVLDVRHMRELASAARHAVIAVWLRDAGAGRAMTTRTIEAVDALMHQSASTGVVAIGDARVRRDGYDLTFTPHSSPQHKEST